MHCGTVGRKSRPGHTPQNIHHCPRRDLPGPSGKEAAIHTQEGKKICKLVISAHCVVHPLPLFSPKPRNRHSLQHLQLASPLPMRAASRPNQIHCNHAALMLHTLGAAADANPTRPPEMEARHRQRCLQTQPAWSRNPRNLPRPVHRPRSPGSGGAMTRSLAAAHMVPVLGRHWKARSRKKTKSHMGEQTRHRLNIHHGS